MEEEESSYELLYKVIIIGDTAVGKSNILSRYVKDEFSSNSKSTVGVELGIKFLKIKNTKTKIQIWDTAGQERYRSLTKFFFQGAKIAILVYDITRKETFDNLKNEWYKQIKEHGDEDVILGIAGNKSDLYDEEAVSEQEARDFAKSIGAVFSLTSAQNNSGIEDFFRNLARRYLGIDTTTDATGGNKPKPKQEQKPGNDNTIKIDSKNATKKKDEKKKGFC